ncbi:conserved repeat domain-containing protein [Acinetobacter marinus]|uniref:Conserved repeat domain-containing protein n=1 Tax=Acinetobacter marinus TaxID=281375 RepID=A0A1G6GLZ0_9GAMM|nr:hypothetical protein [Acinetobacter marinus]SDB83031.1 conserved repeat domain-containing protein [Acinetobacter marinus]
MVNVNQLLRSVAITSLFVTSLQSASANSDAAKEPVSVQLNTYLIAQNAEGKVTEKLVSEVKPEQVVEYRAVYTNNTAGAIKNLVATLPIPAETQFLAKSAPSKALASTDGVNFAPMPLKKKVGNQTVNVPLADYRALRWTIAELPAGKSIAVSAQTRINSTAVNN